MASGRMKREMKASAEGRDAVGDMYGKIPGPLSHVTTSHYDVDSFGLGRRALFWMGMRPRPSDAFNPHDGGRF